MDGYCPFCWSRRVSGVGPPVVSRAAWGGTSLMECGECEKWFWAESGKEVVRLFEICATSLIDPERCIEEIREALNSGGNGFPRRRVAEFNRVCSDCLNARFLAAS
jgi:hypothetical protein